MVMGAACNSAANPPYARTHLVVGALVGVEGQVAQPREGGVEVIVTSAHEQLDAGRDLALVRQQLQLRHRDDAVHERDADLLREVAEPAPTRRGGSGCAGWRRLCARRGRCSGPARTYCSATPSSAGCESSAPWQGSPYPRSSQRRPGRPACARPLPPPSRGLRARHQAVRSPLGPRAGRRDTLPHSSQQLALCGEPACACGTSWTIQP